MDETLQSQSLAQSLAQNIPQTSQNLTSNNDNLIGQNYDPVGISLLQSQTSTSIPANQNFQNFIRPSQTNTSDLRLASPNLVLKNLLADLNQKISATPDKDILPLKVHATTKMIRGISDVLAPRQYKTVINDDGSSTQVPLPRNRKDISMSIALAALTGAFSGLGAGGGLNHLGRAAASGFGAVSQQRQQIQQNLDQQSQADFQRRQSTTEFNLRMLTAARAVGQYDKEDHDAWVTSNSTIAENALNDPDKIAKGSLEDPVSETEAKDIKKWPLSQFMRVPIVTLPRLDLETGDQVWLGMDGKVVPEGTVGAHRAWNNGFLIVKKDLMDSLSDLNGAKSWVSKAVNNGVPGMTLSLLAGDGAKGQLPQSVIGNTIDKNHSVTLAQSIADRFVKTVNTGLEQGQEGYHELIDIKKALEEGRKGGLNGVTLTDLKNLQRAVGTTLQIDIALNRLGDSADKILVKNLNDLKAKMMKDSVTRLSNLFGDLDTYKAQIKANLDARIETARFNAKQNLVTDENSAIAASNSSDLTIQQKGEDWLKAHNQEKFSEGYNAEAGRQQAQEDAIQRDNAKIANSEYRIPTNLVGTMDADQLKNHLIQQKVPILNDYDALYHEGMTFDHELKDVFPVNPRTAAQAGRTNAATAEDFIVKNINPLYHSGMVKGASQFYKTLGDLTKSPVINAGVAIQHLNLLEQAANKMNNGNLSDLNAIAANLGTRTGDNKYKVFQGISEFVNQEVGKVASGGGQNREAELQKLRENVSTSDLTKTIKAVLTGYKKLMAGRLKELEFQNKQYRLGGHINIDLAVTDSLAQEGIETLWEPGVLKFLNGKLIGYSTDDKTLSRVVQ